MTYKKTSKQNEHTHTSQSPTKLPALIPTEFISFILATQASAEPYPLSSCHLQNTVKLFKGSKDVLGLPSLTAPRLTPLLTGLFSHFIFKYHQSKLISTIPVPFISKFNEFALLSSSFARQRPVYIDYAAK